MTAKPIPEGYHSITPGTSIHNCERAIEFYKNVFDAKEQVRFTSPDGKIMHCELKIGDSIFMLGDAVDQPPYHMHVMVYVNNCDVVFKRAVDAGATVKEPLADKFYGDRNGRVTDPFGNEWYIATHKEDISAEEMAKRAEALMKQ